MHFLAIIFFLFLEGVVFAQEIIPEISIYDIPNGVITRNEVIQQHALWGYINGGADIFLEYGFESVRVQEIIWEKNLFKIDIYAMSDEEAAYGIFSVSHRVCKNTEYLSDYQCITKHQIQIAEGKFYISIINKNGTADEQYFSSLLATTLLKKINSDKIIKYPYVLQNNIFIMHINNLIIVKGPIGLQNGFFGWVDLFEGLSMNSVYILPIQIENGNFVIATIRFNREKDLGDFCERAESRRITNKIHSGLIKQSNREIIYYESTLELKHAEQFINAIESMKSKLKPKEG